MRLREANSGVNPRRGQPWMVVTGRGLADVTTPNLISLLFPMLLVWVKAIVTPCAARDRHQLLSVWTF